MPPLLSLSDLRTQFSTKRGQVKAVDGVDLEIREGETVGLVGESGSGKSVTALSTMRLVDDPGEIVGGTVELTDAGLADELRDRYDATGFIDGDTIDLTAAPEEALRFVRGREISMIFQDPMTSLNPSVTVGEQVAESLRLHQYGGRRKDSWFNAVREILPKISRDVDEAVRQETIEVLEEVGIPEPGARIDEYPHEFSGGMRQRVLIAIALASQPRLLVADEPTTALDVTIQAEIMDLMLRLCRDHEVGLILITHDLAVVAQVTQRILVMYAGQVIESGPTRKIIEAARHPYTRGLIAALPQKNRPGSQLNQIPGSMPTLDAIPAGCPFHPRCGYATDLCTREVPALRHLDDGHHAACLRAEEIRDALTAEAAAGAAAEAAAEAQT